MARQSSHQRRPQTETHSGDGRQCPIGTSKFCMAHFLRQIHGDGECGARAGHRHEVRHSFTALTEHVYHNHPGPHYNVKCRSISNDSAPDPHETRAFCTLCCTCVPCGSLSCLVDTTLRRPAIPRTLAKGPGPRTPDMRILYGRSRDILGTCGQRRVQSGKAMNLRKLL